MRDTATIPCHCRSGILSLRCFRRIYGLVSSRTRRGCCRFLSDWSNDPSIGYLCSRHEQGLYFSCPLSFIQDLPLLVVVKLQDNGASAHMYHQTRSSLDLLTPPSYKPGLPTVSVSNTTLRKCRSDVTYCTLTSHGNADTFLLTDRARHPLSKVDFWRINFSSLFFCNS